MFRLPAVLQRFNDDRRGSIAIIFGLSLSVLLFSAALAWDSSRLLNIRSSVATALDAAALAGAKELDPDNYDPAKIQSIAQAFFEEQAYKIRINDVTLDNFRTVANLEERSVEAMVDVQIRSIFGGLAGGVEDLEFTPSAKTRHATRKLEVALVLDITGSMCDAGGGSSVPCTNGEKIDALQEAAKEVVDSLYATYVAAGAVKVSLVPYSASVNVGAYFNSVGTTGGAIDTCVMEREGINMYTNAVPTAGHKFETTGNTSPRPSHYYCPTAQIQPLTDLSTETARAAFKAKIDALGGKGGTAGHIGLAWGWYTLSPEWSSVWPAESDPKPYREDVSKIVILMTDGMFNSSYWNNGGALSGADRTNPLVEDSSPYQALQLCEAIRDRTSQPDGPTIYSVSFMAPPEADALLEDCSGAGNAYTAESRTALIAAFTDIVSRLTKLVLTR